MPPHQWLKIRFEFIAIDNWNINSIILVVDQSLSYD